MMCIHLYNKFPTLLAECGPLMRFCCLGSRWQFLRPVSTLPPEHRCSEHADTKENGNKMSPKAMSTAANWDFSFADVPNMTGYTNHFPTGAKIPDLYKGLCSLN